MYCQNERAFWLQHEMYGNLDCNRKEVQEIGRIYALSFRASSLR
jgi:hypothetical protein